MNRSIVHFFAALACAVLPGCVRWDAVDFAFCDDDETCERGPGEHFCGQTRCVDAVTFGACVAVFTCTADEKCEGVEQKPGFDPSPCVRNECVDGEWISTPRPDSDFDDGDPCTEDWCHPQAGVIHVLIC
jgi:hypothetical protein